MKLSEVTRRYRVSLKDPQDAHLPDRDFREQIKGRHGTIYIWIDGEDVRIAIETEKALYQNRLAKLPWLKRQSWCVFTAHLDRLNDACKLIGAYKRRQMTPEQAQKLGERGRQALQKFHSDKRTGGFQEAK